MGFYFQPASGTLPISSVPWSKYTHVIQYAAQVTFNGSTCGLDTSAYELSGNISSFVSTAHANGVKALISVFQDNAASAIVTCTSPTYLSQFVSTVANFVTSNGYDGVDFDWEGNINNTQFENLIAQTRAALPSPKLITIDGTVTTRTITTAQVNGNYVYNLLDRVNLMDYDSDQSTFSGNYSTVTWYNESVWAGGNSSNVTAEGVLQYFLGAGHPASKITVSVAMYGRVKQGCVVGGVSPGATDVNETYCSGENSTQFPRTAITYRDLLSSVYWTSGVQVWDSTHGANYIRYATGNVNTDAFVTYTGVQQIQQTAALINQYGLGGAFTYTLDYEYLSNQTGDARYPLSTALKNALP